MSTIHIFISYAHEDSQWFRDGSLIPYLIKSLAYNPDIGHVDVWYDKQRLIAGDLWDEEIGKAIKQAHIAILLVSQHFLISDYIRQVELPEIEKRFEKKELIIIPILVDRCKWESIASIRAPQILPSKLTPLVKSKPNKSKWADVQFDILNQVEQQIAKVRTRLQQEEEKLTPVKLPIEDKKGERTIDDTTEKTITLPLIEKPKVEEPPPALLEHIEPQPPAMPEVMPIPFLPEEEAIKSQAPQNEPTLASGQAAAPQQNEPTETESAKPETKKKGSDKFAAAATTTGMAYSMKPKREDEDNTLSSRRSLSFRTRLVLGGLALAGLVILAFVVFPLWQKNGATETVVNTSPTVTVKASPTATPQTASITPTPSPTSTATPSSSVKKPTTESSSVRPTPTPTISASTYIKRANSLYTQRKREAALAACDQALRIDPKNSEALQLRDKIRREIAILNQQPDK